MHFAFSSSSPRLIPFGDSPRKSPACVTWQRKETEQTAASETGGGNGPSEADRFLMECMAKSQAGRKEAAR